MLRLDTPIHIGDNEFTHMLFVRGEWDLRVPYVEVYPALVRDTGTAVVLGVWRLTDKGMDPEYTELLTAIRLSPERNAEGTLSPEQEALVTTLRSLFLGFLENIEQVVIGQQADPDRNRLTHLKFALMKFPLAATFDPIGDRAVGVEVVDERTPQPKEEDKNEPRTI